MFQTQFRPQLRLVSLVSALIAATLSFPAFSFIRHTKPHPASSKPAKQAAVRDGIPAGWKKLSIRDEVAQLVIVPFTGQPLNKRSKTWKDLVNLVRKQHVGGLILVNVSNGRLVQRADPVEAATIIDRMQRFAKVPLLVGGDLERGASMRFNNTTVFPHAMAFAAANDPAAARYEGEVTAQEARAIGVNWVFFPDADVNSNPDNPIINIRSYSEDPNQVALFVDAFLDGANANPRYRVLTTVKHFPGHGDTATDTHLNLATVSADRHHLDEVELVPFKAAIRQGVDSVMTAHLAVPALGTGDLPATLSPAVLTKLLREELGFKGIVVTDALDMGGVAKGFEAGDAAVRAVEAGADVLLMPSDPMAAIDAVVAAVKQGRISKARLDESLARVLMAKAKVGLVSSRYVNVKAIPKLVNLPPSNQRAQTLAQEAVTLVKNDYNMLPILPTAQVCFAILRESATGQQGQAMLPELHKRAPTRPAILFDPNMSEQEMNGAIDQAGACDAWYAAAFVSVAGYRGSVSLGGNYPALMTKLLASGKPVMLVSLGNPYLLRSFPNVAGYLATFSTVPPSEIAAVEALFGEVAIRGHLPVTVPNLAKFGDGIAFTPVNPLSGTRAP